MTLSFEGTVASTTDLTAGFTDVPAGSWLWLFNGGIAASEAAGGVWFSKTPNVGAGTPGIGSKSVTGEDYVGTVSFEIFMPDQPGVHDIVWGGTWDGIDMTGQVAASFMLIPEPAALILLCLGTLCIRPSRKRTS